jgi:hypothetical protein
VELGIDGLSQRVIDTGVVSVTGAGSKINLNDNKLITTSPVGSFSGGVYSGVTGMIVSGRNGGGWNGSGIMTSFPDAVAGLTSLGIATAQEAKSLANPGDTAVFAGQTVTGTDTLVMYTYAGDATLDGKINVDDYGRIDVNAALPGVAGWSNGDFNYDGKINVDDYGIIDFNIAIQGAPIPTGAGASSGLRGVSTVPEPASVSFFLLGACGVANLRRRRRRYK